MAGLTPMRAMKQNAAKAAAQKQNSDSNTKAAATDNDSKQGSAGLTGSKETAAKSAEQSQKTQQANKDAKNTSNAASGTATDGSVKSQNAARAFGRR